MPRHATLDEVPHERRVHLLPVAGRRLLHDALGSEVAHGAQPQDVLHDQQHRQPPDHRVMLTSASQKQVNEPSMSSRKGMSGQFGFRIADLLSGDGEPHEVLAAQVDVVVFDERLANDMGAQGDVVADDPVPAGLGVQGRRPAAQKRIHEHRGLGRQWQRPEDRAEQPTLAAGVRRKCLKHAQAHA